ncbi:MAG TPA: SEC-C domain-containing protein [Blastocatellia bacterium]|nr:SEC-C domain-containing protein [Blastocatellia bacterium]
MEFLSVILAACAESVYRLFDPTVSIRPSGRLIDFSVTLASEAGNQTHNTALKVDTITYGIPMVIAFSVATRADSLFAKLRALVVGALLMIVVSIPFVMVWAKMTSLQLEEQISIAGARSGRATFLFYAFHGYAFSQPVVAVAIWLGMFLLGVFRKRQREETTTVAVSRNAPCPCGSGRKYKRCCGWSK